MKKEKLRIENFLFYDAAGIEAHLEKMAEKGWLIKQITPFFWVYKRIEPEHLRFSVAYFPDASDFDPAPPEGQKTFYEYCLEAGWEPAVQWAQMQVFYTRKENPVPIETEAQVKLKAVHRAMKKNFIPSNVVLLAVLLLELLFQCSLFLSDPIGTLSRPGSVAVIPLFFLLILYMGSGLAGYAVWYVRSKRAAAEGGDCLPGAPGARSAGRGLLLLALLAAAFAVVYSFQGAMYFAVFAITAVLYFMLGAAIFKIREMMKERGVSRRLNQLITFCSAAVLAVGLVAFLSVMIFRMVTSGRYGKGTEPMPLTVEALTDENFTEGASYSREWQLDSTIFLAVGTGRQYSRKEAPGLSYQIAEVRFSPFLSMVWAEMLEPYPVPGEEDELWHYQWETWEEPGLGADAACRLKAREGEWTDRYLARWGNRIISLDFGWSPDAETLKEAFEFLRELDL